MVTLTTSPLMTQQTDGSGRTKYPVDLPGDVPDNKKSANATGSLGSSSAKTAQLLRFPSVRPLLPRPPINRPPDLSRVIIHSHPPANLGEGGLAGNAGEDALRSVLGNRTYLGAAQDFKEVIVRLKNAAKTSGGPLAEITLTTHGGPGVIADGAGNRFGVAVVLEALRHNKIIGKGSRLVLGGCEIAGTGSARQILRELAHEYGITIFASAERTYYGSDALHHWIFPPVGEPYRSTLGIRY